MLWQRIMRALGARRAPLAVSTSAGLVAAAGSCAGNVQAQAEPDVDVVILGGGVVGLCTAWRLALGGRRVVLFDALNPLRGSWGETRASHLAMEDVELLRMGLASMAEWHALEDAYVGTAKDADEAASHRFYLRAGRLMAGPRGSLDGVASAVSSEVGPGEVEKLTAAETNARFPQVRLSEGEECLYMRRGQVLCVNAALAALRWAAERAGATIHEDEVVCGFDRRTRAVTTSTGRTLRCEHLVVAAGPWTNQALARCGLTLFPLVVSNEQTVDFIERDGWREAGRPGHELGEMPLLTWTEAGYKGRAADGSCRYFYCVPHIRDGPHATGGFKVGFHRQGALMETADFVLGEAGRRAIARLPHVRKEVATSQDDGVDNFALEATRHFIETTLPGLDPYKTTMQVRCLYQNTPDLSMIMGAHPEDERVVVLCGFSGSGFQFAPAIGECVGHLINGRARRADSGRVPGGVEQMAAKHAERMLSRFSPRRFQGVEESSCADELPNPPPFAGLDPLAVCELGESREEVGAGHRAAG